MKVNSADPVQETAGVALPALDMGGFWVCWAATKVAAMHPQHIADSNVSVVLGETPEVQFILSNSPGCQCFQVLKQVQLFELY